MFGMGSRLLNVRLGPEDERLARELRSRGISISELVRRALRSEVRAMTAEPVDSDRLLDEIIALYPTPIDLAQKRPTAVDRHAVRKHIRQRLRARR
jgi:hypothetical protein